MLPCAEPFRQFHSKLSWACFREFPTHYHQAPRSCNCRFKQIKYKWIHVVTANTVIYLFCCAYVHVVICKRLRPCGFLFSFSFLSPLFYFYINNFLFYFCFGGSLYFGVLFCLVFCLIDLLCLFSLFFVVFLFCLFLFLFGFVFLGGVFLCGVVVFCCFVVFVCFCCCFLLLLFVVVFYYGVFCCLFGGGGVWGCFLGGFFVVFLLLLFFFFFGGGSFIPHYIGLFYSLKLDSI